MHERQILQPFQITIIILDTLSSERYFIQSSTATACSSAKFCNLSMYPWLILDTLSSEIDKLSYAIWNPYYPFGSFHNKTFNRGSMFKK